MERFLRKKLRNGKFSNVATLTSKTMSAIRGKGNKSTEMRLRMVFVKLGVTGWQLHPTTIFGKPDFYFKQKKLAIFVDGCFWHGCPNCGHIPKTRSPFWQAKIERNRSRAITVKALLKKQGIKVHRVWEHALKDEMKIQRFIEKI